MKVIAIGGEPGSGKTTLMWKLVEHFKVEPKYDSFKLVPYLQKDNVYILGKYEVSETFAGTDRMSMAVQPEAEKFVKSLPKDSIVIYEGDRLFTASFLEKMLDLSDLSIVYLETSKDVRKQRYELRGSEQNETWLNGRESKIDNIRKNMVLLFSMQTFENNTMENQQIVFDKILEIVDGK